MIFIPRIVNYSKSYKSFFFFTFDAILIDYNKNLGCKRARHSRNVRFSNDD